MVSPGVGAGAEQRAGEGVAAKGQEGAGLLRERWLVTSETSVQCHVLVAGRVCVGWGGGCRGSESSCFTVGEHHRVAGSSMDLGMAEYHPTFKILICYSGRRPKGKKLMINGIFCIFVKRFFYCLRVIMN